VVKDSESSRCIECPSDIDKPYTSRIITAPAANSIEKELLVPGSIRRVFRFNQTRYKLITGINSIWENRLLPMEKRANSYKGQPKQSSRIPNAIISRLKRGDILGKKVGSQLADASKGLECISIGSLQDTGP